ncbi:MAG: amidohydrolase family protein, partial [Candidatus Eremiobacteraeota bacterium]|nr:amidohydrolase family protein [Candidatus Eremiobacteraeota bacterium]
GKTITDVGDQTRILGEATGSTQKVNLNGQTMVPGFVEAHAHIIAAVQTVYCTALTAASYPTITAVLQKIQGDINAAPAKSWLFYMSFDPSLLPWDENGAGTGFPQLGFDEFNTLSNPNNVCVWVENASGHIAYANQQAFTAAGVTTNTQPGDGGWFGTYTSGPNEGELNGIMFEPPTFGYFTKFAPTLTTDQVEDAMLGFLKTAQEAGITTVCDPAVGIGGNIAQELELYELIKTSPKAMTDVVGSIDLTSIYSTTSAPVQVAHLNQPAAPGDTGSYFSLTVPNMKLWSDGSTQGYTGYLTQAYLPPVTPEGLPDIGVPDWSQDDMNNVIGQAQADNWSMLIHCNGDAGLNMALSAVQTVYGNAPTAFRNRIEHCTVTDPSQYATMAQLGLTPSYLNNHIAIWGDAFNEYILGNPRASRLDATADASSNGMIFSFHCDYATSEPAPLTYMQTAVLRETPSGVVLGQDQTITADVALQAVTTWPAIQLGLGDSIGLIQIGYDADLAWLADDPLTVASSAIGSIPVVETMLKGTRLTIASGEAAAV